MKRKIDKSEMLDGDFLKQFKTSKDFSSFMEQLYKRGVEQLLEGELDAHLGYEKHQSSSTKNSRNGHTHKKIRSEYGEDTISVPRDREGSFEPVLVPKRSQITTGIEQLVVSLYAKGMSNSDIEQQIAELYGFQVSTTSISVITDKVSKYIIAWQNRPFL